MSTQNRKHSQQAVVYVLHVNVYVHCYNLVAWKFNHNWCITHMVAWFPGVGLPQRTPVNYSVGYIPTCMLIQLTFVPPCSPPRHPMPCQTPSARVSAHHHPRTPPTPCWWQHGVESGHHRTLEWCRSSQCSRRWFPCQGLARHGSWGRQSRQLAGCPWCHWGGRQHQCLYPRGKNTGACDNNGMGLCYTCILALTQA